jgi:hypothetical protein
MIDVPAAAVELASNALPRRENLDRDIRRDSEVVEQLAGRITRDARPAVEGDRS